MPLLLIILALLCPGALHAQGYDPSSDWRTLESDHFRFHYPAPLRDAVEELAPIAEGVHRKLSPTLQWTPRQRTEVVITDQTDLGNGRAGPLPFNQIHMTLRQPETGSITDPQSRRHWLQFLFIHEYAHVLHFDRAEGSPAALRGVFGRLLPLFPALLAPRFWHEGLATDFETRLDPGYGRGRHPEFTMVMRAEARRGLRPLGALAHPKRRYPGALLDYSYGVYFFQFLRRQYGPERLQQWLEAYADNLVPFQVNTTMRQAYEYDLRQLWEQFRAELEARFDTEQEQRRRAGLTPSTPLTATVPVDRHEAVVQDDGSILVVRDDQHRHTALLHLQVDGGRNVLHRLEPGSRIRGNGRGLVLTQPQPCGLFRTYFDLYLLPRPEAEPQRLTRCGRYSEAALAPDGETIAAVRHPRGGSQLVLLDRAGELLRVLAESDGAHYFTNPVFAPDGSALAFVLSDEATGARLREIAPDGTRLRDYPLAGLPPRGLNYSPDARELWYAQAVDDVYELVRLQRDSGERSVVTRSDSGALAPTPLGDGSVLFKSYTSDGFALHRLPAAARLARPAPAPRDNPAPQWHAPAPTGPERSYRPWSTLAPRYWFPYAYSDGEVSALGFSTTGSDALEQHRYGLTLARDLEQDEWVGSAWYRFSEYLTLTGSRTDESIDRDGDFARVRQTDRLGLVLSWPWRLPGESRLTAQVGGHYQQRRDVAVDPVVGRRPLNYRRDRVAGFNLMYDSTEHYRYSLGAVDGRRLAVTFESGEPLDGDFPGEVWQARWYEYLALGGDHSLELTAWYGHADTDAEPFQLGGAGDPLWPGWQVMPFGQRDIHLRGYDSDEAALVGERAAHLSASWRFPLAIPEWGGTVPPLGLNRISGTFFLESGSVWNARDSLDEHYDSAGAELVLDAAAGYLLPLRLRLGVARGLDDELGETQLYAIVHGIF